jgi:hypothetical protein
MGLLKIQPTDKKPNIATALTTDGELPENTA